MFIYHKNLHYKRKQSMKLYIKKVKIFLLGPRRGYCTHPPRCNFGTWYSRTYIFTAKMQQHKNTKKTALQLAKTYSDAK